MGHLAGACPRQRRPTRSRQGPQAAPQAPLHQHQQQSAPAAPGDTSQWQEVGRRRASRANLSRPVVPSSPVVAGIPVASSAFEPLQSQGQDPPPATPAPSFQPVLTQSAIVPYSSSSSPRPPPPPPPPSAMDLEFPPLQTLVPASSVTAPPPPPSASPHPDCAPQVFLELAPPSWGFETVQYSADAPGPIEVRVYISRRGHRLLYGSKELPMFSFTLPLSSESSWSTGSIMDFTHRHLLVQIQQWLGEGAARLFASQSPQCFGRARWLDHVERYCLPVVLQLSPSWEETLGLAAITEWSPASLARHFRCPISYIQQWFIDIDVFAAGAVVPTLPLDPFQRASLMSSQGKESKRRRR